MKNTLLSLAMTAAMTVATTFAQAAPVTVNETSLGTGSPYAAVSNIEKLNGGYTEMITINPDGTFVATAYATFTQYFDTNGDAIPAGGPTAATDLGDSYRLISTFNATGKVNPDGTLSGTGGSFSLYADLFTEALTPTFGLTATTPVSISGGVLGTDYLLLASSANQTFGLGTGIGTQAAAFKFLFDSMSLTADGMDFFIAPNPFYVEVNVNGDIDNGLPGVLPGTYSRVLGDVSVTFLGTVPEPSSLALMGAALAGLGFAQRRRQQAAK